MDTQVNAHEIKSICCTQVKVLVVQLIKGSAYAMQSLNHMKSAPWSRVQNLAPLTPISLLFLARSLPHSLPTVGSARAPRLLHAPPCLSTPATCLPQTAASHNHYQSSSVPRDPVKRPRTPPPPPPLGCWEPVPGIREPRTSPTLLMTGPTTVDKPPPQPGGGSGLLQGLLFESSVGPSYTGCT